MNTAKKRVIYHTIREMVAPEHTALVVWDVQNSLVNSAFNKAEFLKNLKPLIAAARVKGIPVLYTKITPLPLEFESPMRLYMHMKRAGVTEPEKLPQSMQPGSAEAEIHTDIAPQKGDIVLNKHTADIFIGTHFENLMRNRGISTIIFTGISTEIGIDSSARGSGNRGFYTIVVNDCVTTADKEMHDASLKTLARVCVVTSSADVMKEWKL